jgi:hypothetical protein
MQTSYHIVNLAVSWIICNPGVLDLKLIDMITSDMFGEHCTISNIPFPSFSLTPGTQMPIEASGSSIYIWK